MMEAGRRITALTFALLGTAALAQYRWVDETGQINYGDSPPASARDVRRIDARVTESTDANLALPFELRRAMSQFPVTLYLSDECQPCDNGRALLRKRGIPFSERMIDTPAASAELKRLAGSDKVPVLAVGRELQAGFDLLKWERSLDAAGYPARASSATPSSTNAGQPVVARSQGATPPGKASTTP